VGEIWLSLFGKRSHSLTKKKLATMGTASEPNQFTFFLVFSGEKTMEQCSFET
jgi:hypothetical protein